MSQIRVRRMTPEDWQIWRAVRLAALTDAPRAFASTLDREQGYDERTWRDQVEPGRGVKVVALTGDAPVGVAAGWVHREWNDAVELFGMWVAPSARGTGVGDALVHQVLDWAHEGGHPQVRLWVVEDNHRARRLYERLGFIRTAETQPHPSHPGLCEQLMVRDLVGGLT